ncbi:MAG: PAC2 family protein [Aurantimicrobium sp.]|nr:PAC2 family protein [Aurantimicrobium sp.]
MATKKLFGGRVLVVAFEGWNDAGEAASSAVRTLHDDLEVFALLAMDSERYYDYQYTRPTVSFDDDGSRVLSWPTTTLYAPLVPSSRGASISGDSRVSESGTNVGNVYLLLGVEPSRNWQTFATEVIDAALAADVDAMVFLGAQLADVPHTRPTTINVSSENSAVRGELDVERSQYEGPVGIISVLSQAAESADIPTVNLWASVPHYVQHSPSPKATLALIDRLEEIIDVTIPRGSLVADAAAWEESINQLAADDDDMAAYIGTLEQARDAVDSPSASGEAIAQEFERFLRKTDGDGGAPTSSSHPGPGE